MIRRKTRFISIMLSVVMLFGMMGYISIDNTYAASKKIHLKKTTVSLVAGKTYQQKLINKNGKTINATKVKWKSAKTSVAKIDKKGKIKAVKAGTAKMTAKYKGKTYKFTVKVSKPNLKAPRILDIRTGGDENKIIVSFSNVNNAISYEVYCSKNGGDFKKIDYEPEYEDGFIIHGGYGTYVFKVRAVAGSYKGPFSKEQSFINADHNTVVEVEPSSIDLKVGETKSVNVLTDGGCSLSYQCNNNNVNCNLGSNLSGTNTSTTLRITGVEAGTTVIDVYDTKDNSVKASITVTIHPDHNTVVEVDSPSIELKIGETKAINVITDAGYGITYKKSNSNVNCKWGDWISGTHTVPLEITGVEAGTTVIDVYDTKDNSVKDSITVTIKPDWTITCKQSFPLTVGGYYSSSEPMYLSEIESLNITQSKDSFSIEIKGTVKKADTTPVIWYRVFDEEGYVVDNGLIRADASEVGLKFKSSNSCRLNNPMGNYTLEFYNDYY